MWSEKGYFVVDGHLPPDICLPGKLPPSTNAPGHMPAGQTPPGQTPIKDLSVASVTIPASPAAYSLRGC